MKIFFMLPINIQIMIRFTVYLVSCDFKIHVLELELCPSKNNFEFPEVLKQAETFSGSKDSARVETSGPTFIELLSTKIC